MDEKEIKDVCAEILGAMQSKTDKAFYHICSMILFDDELERLESMKENQYFRNASFCIDKGLIRHGEHFTLKKRNNIERVLIVLMNAFEKAADRRSTDRSRRSNITEALRDLYQINEPDFPTALVAARNAAPPRPASLIFGRLSTATTSRYKEWFVLAAMDFAALASMAMFRINLYTVTSSEFRMHTAALVTLVGADMSTQRKGRDDPLGMCMYVLLQLFRSVSIILLQYICNAPGWSDALDDRNINDTVLMRSIHNAQPTKNLQYAGIFDHSLIVARQLIPFAVSLFFIKGNKLSHFVHSISFANHALSRIPGGLYGSLFNAGSERLTNAATRSGYVGQLTSHVKLNRHTKSQAHFYALGNPQQIKDDAMAFLMLADTHLEPWKDPFFGMEAFTWATNLELIKQTKYPRGKIEMSDNMKKLLPIANKYFLRMPFAQFSFEEIVQRVVNNLKSKPICRNILGRKNNYNQDDIDRFKEVMHILRPTIEAFLATFYSRFFEADSHAHKINFDKWTTEYGKQDHETHDLLQEIDSVFFDYLKKLLHITDSRFESSASFADYTGE
jgi:hypothetical protein